jgi:hypothetical protein
MHHQPKGADSKAPAWAPAAQDTADQELVLLHVLETYPTHLRLSELTLEVTGGSTEFEDRDRIERAVRDLAGAGLLFRSEALVLPTRSAIRFHEILNHSEADASFS